MFYLPYDTQEYLSVDEMFHLAPVLSLLNDLKDYYVLCVTQHKPKIYKGDLYGLSEILIGLPNNLEEGLLIDEIGLTNERQGSVYASTKGFNARGGHKNSAEEERHRFWRMIDQRVLKYTDKKLPLILAGTKNEISEYRRQTNYPKVLNRHVDGVNESRALFSQALKLFKEEIIKPRHEAIVNQYLQLGGMLTDKIANDFTAITKAADDGRVDKLIVSGIKLTTDTVQDNSEPVPVITMPPEETAQLSNYITREVWGSGGELVNIEAGSMLVEGRLMLAIMRY